MRKNLKLGVEVIKIQMLDFNISFKENISERMIIKLWLRRSKVQKLDFQISIKGILS